MRRPAAFPEGPPIGTALTSDAASRPLFDCDGTLVDALANREEARTRALAEHGLHITPDPGGAVIGTAR